MKDEREGDELYFAYTSHDNVWTMRDKRERVTMRQMASETFNSSNHLRESFREKCSEREDLGRNYGWREIDKFDAREIRFHFVFNFATTIFERKTYFSRASSSLCLITQKASKRNELQLLLTWGCDEILLAYLTKKDKYVHEICSCSKESFVSDVDQVDGLVWSSSMTFITNKSTESLEKSSKRTQPVEEARKQFQKTPTHTEAEARGFLLSGLETKSTESTRQSIIISFRLLFSTSPERR